MMNSARATLCRSTLQQSRIRSILYQLQIWFKHCYSESLRTLKQTTCQLNERIIFFLSFNNVQSQLLRQTILSMKHYKGNFKMFQQHDAFYWPEQLAEAQGLANCFGQEEISERHVCFRHNPQCVLYHLKLFLLSTEALEHGFREKKKGEYIAEQDTLQSKLLVSSLSTFFICLCIYTYSCE